MAYDRSRTGPWPWLKCVGSQDQPLRPDWRADDMHLLTHCWFAKHPRSLRAGDVLVYYAARWGVLPALIELVSDEVEDDLGGHHRDGRRWRWRMAVRPLVTLPLGVAPSLAEIGIDPLRVRRQSHILLTRTEYEAARNLVLERAAAAVDEPSDRRS
ncbi:MAG: hypothetical protein ACJ76L_09025 [Conexibacter sp.]